MWGKYQRIAQKKRGTSSTQGYVCHPTVQRAKATADEWRKRIQGVQRELEWCEHSHHRENSAVAKLAANAGQCHLNQADVLGHLETK